VGDRAGQGAACGNLGICYSSLGQYAKAIELHEQDQAIAQELGDRAGQGRSCSLFRLKIAVRVQSLKNKLPATVTSTPFSCYRACSTTIIVKKQKHFSTWFSL
jgi:hypothetical protein